MSSPPKKQKWKSLLFILILCLTVSSAIKAEEALRLEGVIEDPANQAESFAVINGNMVKPGDKMGVYQVKEIQGTHVKLSHQETRVETSLYLKDKEPSAASLKPVPEIPAPPSPRTVMDEAKDYMRNPSKAVDRAWELKAVRDLAVINNACVKYYERNKFFPVSMRQLTLDGYLPAEYEKGNLNKYQFYFKNTPMKPDDLQLHADPLEKKNELRSFFIGADAVIREAAGRPAQAQSSPHDYPGRKA